MTSAALERSRAREDDRRRRYTAPDRSLEQRLAALATANRIRTARKELKRDLERGHDGDGGRVTVYDVLRRRDHADLATMKVRTVLLATPTVGRVKADVILQRSRISPSKTLGGLTARQVRELALVLGAYPALRR